RLRTLAGKSQAKLAEALFVDENTIARWEQDVHRPGSIEIIEDISKQFSLSYSQEYFLLGLAGHVLKTRMPRLSQIKEVLGHYIIDIEENAFPSVIVDYRFTQWAKNSKAVLVNGD